MKKDYFKKILIGYLQEDGKGGDQRQDGRHTQNDGRMCSARWRLGRQTLLEIWRRKRLPHVAEQPHTYIQVHSHLHV
jgi:hypothetical protein